MNQLFFVREKNGYTILEHNDERLYVVAELLLNPAALSQALELIDNPEQHRGKSGEFAFEKHGVILIIKLYDAFEAISDKDEPLVIDIHQEELKKVVEQWKALQPKQSHEIIMLRDADNFSLMIEEK